MRQPFQTLTATCPTDGAFSLRLDPRSGAETEAEVADLMNAWYAERARLIEAQLLLDDARRTIARLLEYASPSPARRHQASRLVLAIRRHLRLTSDQA